MEAYRRPRPARVPSRAREPDRAHRLLAARSVPALRRDRADHVQRLHARRRDGRGRARQPVLLRRSPVDLRGRRHRADVRGRPHRLLALPRAARRDLHGDDRPDHPRAVARRGVARFAPLDRAAVLHLPAVGARQDPARRHPGGVRSRPRAGDAPSAARRCESSRSACCRRCSCSCSRTSARRSSTASSRSPFSLPRVCAGPISRALVGGPRRDGPDRACGRPGRRCPYPRLVPAGSPHGFPAPLGRSG